MRRYNIAFVLSFLVGLCPVASSASLSFLPPPDHRPKAFAMIQAPDGYWHVFYIKNLFNPPAGQRPDREIGHAKSLDLTNWTPLPTALAPEDTGWDSTAVWAP